MASPTHRTIRRSVCEAIDLVVHQLQHLVDNYDPERPTTTNPLHIKYLKVTPCGLPPCVIEVYTHYGQVKVKTDMSELPEEYYGGLLSRSEVYDHINKERDYQIQKWGSKPQSLAGYLLVLKKEIDEAIDGWMKNSTGRDAPLNEITQVAAVAVACLEQYGCEGITINQSDLPGVPNV